MDDIIVAAFPISMLALGVFAIVRSIQFRNRYSGRSPQGYHDRYSAMQDTSDRMYNKHGVHKHNPMLDR